MLKVVGIGDNVVDRYLYKNKMYPGGNAVNVPVLAKKTGRAVAAYIGCLGNDYAGQHVLGALQHEGIDVSQVRILEGKNAYADVTLIDSDRVFIGGDVGVSQNIQLNEKDIEFICHYNLIHTSIYSGIDDILEQIKGIGLKVAYDYSDQLDIKMHIETFKYVDIAIFSGGSTPEEELKELMKKVAIYGPSQIIMTMGARGAILYIDGQFYKQGIYKIDNIVDTMGAGDSFIARYFVGIYDGESIEESMKNAAEYAAKNCLVNGTFGYETDIK